MNNFEAFVYVWTNTKNNMYYIGKHKGSEDDGYISSGKYFLDAYNADPTTFERTIVFRGTHDEVRKEENRRIDEAIRNSGYERIYNLTTWDRLRRWKRTCLHCGSVCCPENEQWAEAFEKIHFDNCSKSPKNLPINTNWKIPQLTISSKKAKIEKKILKKEEKSESLTRRQLTRKQERIAWWKEYDRKK